MSAADLFIERAAWMSRGWMLRTWVCATLVVTGIFLAIIVLGVAVQSVIVYDARTSCGKFENASGYPTEFAYYGFWKQECFVVTPSGVRIPQSKFIYNEGN